MRAEQAELVDGLGAPQSRSSGGRSAVRTISGTRAWYASTTAGNRLAAAVPEVQTSATGVRDAFARPSAKKPAARSSTCVQLAARSARRSAIASGAERLPGAMQTWRTPARASSSARRTGTT